MLLYKPRYLREGGWGETRILQDFCYEKTKIDTEHMKNAKIMPIYNNFSPRF